LGIVTGRFLSAAGMMVWSGVVPVSASLLLRVCPYARSRSGDAPSCGFLS
jgi:hypothetical protein